jgi:hypothetical protein
MQQGEMVTPIKIVNKNMFSGLISANSNSIISLLKYNTVAYHFCDQLLGGYVPQYFIALWPEAGILNLTLV